MQGAATGPGGHAEPAAVAWPQPDGAWPLKAPLHRGADGALTEVTVIRAQGGFPATSRSIRSCLEARGLGGRAGCYRRRLPSPYVGSLGRGSRGADAACPVSLVHPHCWGSAGFSPLLPPQPLKSACWGLRRVSASWPLAHEVCQERGLRSGTWDRAPMLRVDGVGFLGLPGLGPLVQSGTPLLSLHLLGA